MNKGCFSLICQKTGKQMEYIGMTPDEEDSAIYIGFNCEECSHIVLVKWEKGFEGFSMQGKTP